MHSLMFWRLTAFPPRWACTNSTNENPSIVLFKSFSGSDWLVNSICFLKPTFSFVPPAMLGHGWGLWRFVLLLAVALSMVCCCFFAVCVLCFFTALFLFLRWGFLCFFACAVFVFVVFQFVAFMVACLLFACLRAIARMLVRIFANYWKKIFSMGTSHNIHDTPSPLKTDIG